ncbi:hypothetical protein JZO70_09000 [Enterococcus sp. 669A]|uniref:HTH cro/C1-type domain-containing protein n=1 Tax=Candidatus Enterococcus moelleringii TaxID=2815325 RepID=A0ABS3L9J6_9ENTE|nr:hypothetical protein [Enterococcus sp. 669A]MBO1306296.1 hypothetical protein [Enterococcus sp. 669A]
MSINQESAHAEFWQDVPYETKTGELLTIANNLNWSLEELAAKMNISSEQLVNIISMEEVDDALATKALVDLFPLLDTRVKEQRRNIERRKGTHL